MKISYLLIFIMMFLFVTKQSFGQPNIKPDDTLPVELIYFDGYIMDGYVLLKWGTATELSNYGFDVERASSSPLLVWETLGFVFGHGTSFSPKHYEFEDTTVSFDGIYHYRLKQIDTDGAFAYSDTVTLNLVTSLRFDPDINQVKDFSLEQNYPNPFNPSTTIKFQIPFQSKVTLKIFDAIGNHISTLIDKELSSGSYTYHFDASRFKNPASGIYFYQLKANQFTRTKKFVLTK